ncbi:hypothetical protein B0H16DRAFT_1453613 [Mycena metata]|uniref:Uncharacterized protein n=1 Tax=Mycena metata TaxID=1033252 RepID=A0AAD7JPD1_9AGAR|nr:hypothetical protein B0H16DRAFT_1453613 [Mycena metata]
MLMNFLGRKYIWPPGKIDAVWARQVLKPREPFGARNLAQKWTRYRRRKLNVALPEGTLSTAQTRRAPFDSNGNEKVEVKTHSQLNAEGSQLGYESIVPASCDQLERGKKAKTGWTIDRVLHWAERMTVVESATTAVTLTRLVARRGNKEGLSRKYQAKQHRQSFSETEGEAEKNPGRAQIVHGNESVICRWLPPRHSSADSGNVIEQTIPI